MARRLSRIEQLEQWLYCQEFPNSRYAQEVRQEEEARKTRHPKRKVSYIGWDLKSHTISI